MSAMVRAHRGSSGPRVGIGDARGAVLFGGWKPPPLVRVGMGVARGAVLLEVMLSLAIFVSAAMAIMAAVDRGLGSMNVVRHSERAADMARTAMARLEAGIDTPATLQGPVPLSWFGSADEQDEFAFDQDTGWELEVETEPTIFQGLTRVSVRAIERSPANPDSVIASYTLYQLVRLASDAADEVGQEDELMDAARRGLRDRSGTGGQDNGPPGEHSGDGQGGRR